MRYKLEKVPQRPGMSWRHMCRQAPTSSHEPHYHQEFELNLHLHCQGQIQLGQYQGGLTEHHLILIPPQMTHAVSIQHPASHPQAESHSIWFKKEWMANMIFSCVEMRKVDSLLKKSDKGILFSPDTAKQVHRIISQLDYSSSSIHQLAVLLNVIAVLCQDSTAITLAPISSETVAKKQDENKEKIDRLCDYLESNYADNITLSQLSKHLYISESSLHRLFLRHFGESFSQHLKKVRLSHAARLLETTNLRVSYIAEAVGYRNQANFNRKFKSYKQLTPREYREKHQG